MSDLARPKAERKSVRFQFKFVDEATVPGTFEGYGSVFGNEDDGGDLILPGAFTGVLARHAARAACRRCCSITAAWAADCSAAAIR